MPPSAYCIEELFSRFGFGVLGLVSRAGVDVLGFRILELGCGVQGLEFRVSG